LNIKNVKHIGKLKSLGYPLREILVIGSSTMALYELKDNHDLDLWVTEKVYRKMLKDSRFFFNGRLLESKDGSIEASYKLPCSNGNIEDNLKRATIVNGVHFQCLKDVLAWKKCMKRTKDIEHIRMIEDYMKKHLMENYLSEIQHPKTMYHASRKQNLKVLSPISAKEQTQRKYLNNQKGYIWASPDKEYAASFCIPRSSSLGFRCGFYPGDKHRTMEVPKKFEKWLYEPCSIYSVNVLNFKKEEWRTTPDWITDTQVKVIKEEKYKTAKECLQKNNIKIVVYS